jgi:hydroxyacylglutathione hydrolase
MISIEIFTFNEFQENTYLLQDETGDAVLIDPGMNSAKEESEFVRFVTDKNIRIVKIVNTHCHIDHVMGNAFSVSKFKCPLLYPKGEQRTLESGVQVAKMYQLSYDPSPNADEHIAEGDTIEFGNSILRVVSAPGHSPDHIVLVHDIERFVIGGDVLFRGSVGRTDLPGGNEAQLCESIEKKIYTLPEDFMVYPGHGPATKIGLEKSSNPLVNGSGTGLFQSKRKG